MLLKLQTSRTNAQQTIIIFPMEDTTVFFFTLIKQSKAFKEGLRIDTRALFKRGGFLCIGIWFYHSDFIKYH